MELQHQPGARPRGRPHWDHIKIYPGSDRIQINDELVTLPGTVPTQGYGVYLPLRLLQERGYLPSADRLQKNATPW
jgi:hypothetical protein